MCVCVCACPPGYYRYIGDAGRRDHIEAFHVERECSDDERMAMRLPYFEAREWPRSMYEAETRQGNRWPHTVVGAPPSAGVLKNTLVDYFEACNATCDVLLSALARGLGLDGATFTRMHSHHDSQLELKRYPPAEVDSPRIGDHRDLTSVTLLTQDSVGGLEIWDREASSWLPAPARPDWLLVNTGDFMAAWTGERLLSTRHRVMPALGTAPAVDGGASRYSAVFFCTPDWHANTGLVGGLAGWPQGTQQSPVNGRGPDAESVPDALFTPVDDELVGDKLPSI